MRILIVDDDFLSRKLLTRELRKLGTCDQACDGEEGLQAYKSALAVGAPYDLILLDIVMPGMDGGELLRKIRADESSRAVAGESRCAIAMATTQADKQTVMRSFRDEADGYIIKPYLPGSVLRYLRRHDLISPA
ncbi:MAG: response regulator [Fibrobacteres bacterium]|jgi:two-component system chemotaxis response regulator CheY|nr:response regulator [Fibrobacterota bacterium]